MRIFRHGFRTCVRGLWAPLVGALAICWTCVALVPRPEGAGADHAVGQWLHVPGLLLVASALGAVLEAWPLFSRARPGYGWLLRIESRAPHGCLRAALGALTALTLALAAAAAVFSAMLGALAIDSGDVRARIATRAGSKSPYLDARSGTLAFEVAGSGAARAVRIRPVAVFAGRANTVPTRLQVAADGRVLHDGWLSNSGDPIRLGLEPPRAIRRITIRRHQGPGMVLRITAERVELVADARRSRILNGILALLSYLGPATLALAVMIVGHTRLALPVNFAAGFVTTLLTTLLEYVPTSRAITAFARGHWIPAEAGILSGSLWVLFAAAGLVALAVAASRLGAPATRRAPAGPR